MAYVLVAAIAAAVACRVPEPERARTETVDYSEALDITVDPGSDRRRHVYRWKTVSCRARQQPARRVAALRLARRVLVDARPERARPTTKTSTLDFPVRITGATLTVKQATGGIITPPSGTEKESFEYVPLAASGNQFSGIANPITLSFEVWYDLPSLRRECVVTLTYSFVDNDGTGFSRSVDFKVAP